mmetsp:Transcript_24440/g.56066  ORF Transcript_24440/g.56066 Transcript_24440/m.56066 type:complete len:171 (+) Transcript_24440:1-513(+)
MSSSNNKASPTTAGTSNAPRHVSSSSNNSAAVVQHGEDRLNKTWRTLANCFIVGGQKAEKVLKEQQGNPKSTTTTTTNPKDLQAAKKEMDDYVVLFLRTRVEFGRLCSYLEAKLEGTAQEMETIQHYHRTLPTLGGSSAAVVLGKRTRAEETTDDVPSKRSAMTPTPPGL